MIGALDPFEEDGHVEEYRTAKILAYSIDQLALTKDSPMNILASMSIIAGELALMDALQKTKLASPQTALIIGTGIAGMAAIEQALKQNLNVIVISVNQQHLDLFKENANVTGIYLPRTDPLEKQQQLVLKSAKQADVMITSARSPGQKAPLLLPLSTLKIMKQGAAVIDLALSEGGNVEGSHHDQTLEIGNKVIVSNISGYPKARPHEASMKWSLASRLFIESLASNQQEALLKQALIS